jgi:CMP/dCMP kinase
MNAQSLRTLPKGPVIAIDGPAGTGKSSVTKRLAEVLGFVHVDTGALYRCVGLLSIEKNLKLDHEIVKLAEESQYEFKRDMDKIPSNRVWVNGRDVTDFIRTPEVSMAASKVSSLPGVRSALLGLQRSLGSAGPSILEGRDIGTVIFPDAEVKFFLTASVEERARRRHLELLEAARVKGRPDSEVPSVESLAEQIQKRDFDDSTRASAPMKKADNAIEIDTTQYSFEEVVNLMIKKIEERLPNRPT